MKPLEEDIRIRAYLLWEQNGRPHGYHVEHWLVAEQETAAPANDTSDYTSEGRRTVATKSKGESEKFLEGPQVKAKARKAVAALDTPKSETTRDKRRTHAAQRAALKAGSLLHP